MSDKWTEEKANRKRGGEDQQQTPTGAVRKESRGKGRKTRGLTGKVRSSPRKCGEIYTRQENLSDGKKGFRKQPTPGLRGNVGKGGRINGKLVDPDFGAGKPGEGKAWGGGSPFRGGPVNGEVRGQPLTKKRRV